MFLWTTKEAEKWFLLAAEQGEQISQTCLGAMYATPQGVSQNYEAALKWYQKAAEQGNALAQFDLGGMHADGRGVPQDYKIAVKWWHKAAGQGFTAAQFSLGVTCMQRAKGVLPRMTQRLSSG